MLRDFSGRPLDQLRAALAALQTVVENLEIEAGTVDQTARDAAAAAAGAAAAAQAGVDVLAAALPGARTGTITLSGANPTPVSFGEDAAAFMLGGEAAPFDLSTNGLTFVVTVDSTEDTATFNCAAGTSVSGETPAVDITGEVDTKFMISVDGDEAEEVTLDKAGKDDGTKIATEMQTKIRALGGNKAAVTVALVEGEYVITSGTKGTGSSVVITPAASGSITEELKIGVLGGGIETAGTGDFVNAAAATADEVIAVLTADLGDIVATAADGAVKITAATATVGADSSIVIGAGTANNVLGFTQGAAISGAQGLGYETDMADASYVVLPVLTGATATDLGLSITAKTAAGFNVVCETAASTAAVDLLIVGAPAAE